MSSIINGGWDNPSSSERNELVFENRNKDYGAYIIRKKYRDYVLTAALIGVSSFVLGITGPMIYDKIMKEAEEAANKRREVKSVAELAPPPPMDEKLKPPPPITPPELKSVNFTPPVVKPDEEVQEEVAVMDEMKDAIIGNKNVEGDTASNYQPIEEVAVNTEVEEDNNRVFTVVEQQPEFPGGEEELFRYLSKNINYPTMARENGITGRVVVTFVVGSDGDINNIQVIRPIGGGCDEEAVRVVKKMPRWKAGKQNGKSVNVQFNLPINFELK
jgi:protein TonB